jgi:hypothetical protein
MKWSPMHAAGRRGSVAQAGPLFAVVRAQWAGNYRWWIAADLDDKSEERAVGEGVAATEVEAQEHARWALREILSDVK